MARRKPDDDHENHDRWLVSYADFITLLFAFFVVMYSLSSINEGKYRVLSDSLVQAFRSMDVNTTGAKVVVPLATPVQVAPPHPAPTPGVDSRLEARRLETSQRMRNMAEEIKQVLAPLAKGGQVRISEGAFGITVEINASVLFPPGEADLGQAAAGTLQAVAKVLAGTSFPITVEGHTDNSPINTFRFPSNWELSAVRASSVVRLFIANGVPANNLSVAGYGDQRPIASNDTEAGRARNRRVTITIESRQVDPTPRQGPGTLRQDDPLRGILPEGGAQIPAATSAAPAATP